MIQELSIDYKIAPLCKLLDVSRNGYYTWRDRPQSERDQYNKQLLKAMLRIQHHVKGTYGSPRMTVALNRKGYTVCENTVAIHMQRHNIRAKMERRFKPRQWSPNSLIKKKNLLEEFRGPLKRNDVWVADVTYLRVKGKRVYLSTIMDVYSRKILGSNVSFDRDSEMILNTVQRALKTTGGERPTIFHSDRGAEYANYTLHDYLKNLHVKQSMSGKGSCYDNAFAESFFHTYKSEFYHHEQFKNVDELKKKTKNYIRFYNEKRLHSSLGYLSPIEYDGQAQ